MNLLNESFKIVTPSYKRCNKVKAFDVFGEDLIIFCHSFEVDKYKLNYPDNQIMEIPDNLKGNMAKVRNFIKDNIDSKYYIMVDDDLQEIGKHESQKQIKLDKDSIYGLIENGFIICEQLNTFLWGLNLQSDPKFYREFTPISLLSVVLGPFSCHIENDLRYDERLGLNEDYDYALQVLHKYHKVLRLNKYYYLAGHLKEKGGCGSYRLLDEEKKQAEIMINKWGNDIVKYNFNKSTNPNVNVPLRGI